MSPVDPAHAGSTSTALAGETLENRYGSGRRGKRDRRFAYGAVAALLAAGVVFLLFSGWETTKQVEWQDIGYTKRSDLVIDIKFELTAPANTPVACAVESLNKAKATVGWKIVEIPPSENRSHTITTKLVSTNPLTAAAVRECWVVS